MSDYDWVNPDQGRMVLRKRRPRDEHDQPLPVPNAGPSMHDLVIEDIKARKAIGLRRYGALLQAHNGRDALRDAYEEVLDLAIYLRQYMAEREENP